MSTKNEKQNEKIDLEAIFAKRGNAMTLNEVKVLAGAANETLRAMKDKDMQGWAARLPCGRRTKAQADAVIAAEARAIILKLVDELIATKAEILKLMDGLSAARVENDKLKSTLDAAKDEIFKLKSALKLALEPGGDTASGLPKTAETPVEPSETPKE